MTADTDLASFGRLPPFALFDEFGVSCDDRVQNHYHAEIARLKAHAVELKTALHRIDEWSRAVSEQSVMVAGSAVHEAFNQMGGYARLALHDRRRAARVKTEGQRRRDRQPKVPPGFRLVSQETVDAAELALMRKVCEYSTDLYRAIQHRTGGANLQVFIREREKTLAALRELNPYLADRWAGERYAYFE